ncbi:MAG TPA: hypothetical protein VI932_07475 [Bacteroidota bacterium]|nr:hypothetical protein [Bacteroidota bacterium]
MVPIMSLWLPIFLSAVFVFIVSSLIHMVFKYHASDFKKMPGEDQAMDALGKLKIPPGDYVMPYAGSMKAMADPAYIEKYKKGPVAFFTIFPSGPPGMGKELALWFLYSVVIGIFAAYVAGRALGPGAGYLAVHRFAGVIAFAGYALGLLQNSIWYKRSWSSTLKSMFDGLIYASVTGGTFGWLWPAA